MSGLVGRRVNIRLRMVEGAVCDNVEDESVIYCVGGFGNVYGGGCGSAWRFVSIEACCDVSDQMKKSGISETEYAKIVIGV